MEATSIAFPAISTGIFGYPIEAAADVAVATVRAFAGPVDLVRLVAFDAAGYQALAARVSMEG